MGLSDLQYELIAALFLLVALLGLLLLIFARRDRRRDWGLVIMLVGLALFVSFMKLVS